MDPQTCQELSDRLLAVLKEYGTPTEGTYELLDSLIASILPEPCDEEEEAMA